jgi:hypothetical protein
MIFELLNVEQFIKEHNAPAIMEPLPANLNEQKLLSQINGLYSQYLFGERKSSKWFEQMGYIPLNVYIPKFPVLMILDNLPTIRAFRNRPDKVLAIDEEGNLVLEDEKEISYTNHKILMQGFADFFEKNKLIKLIEYIAQQNSVSGQLINEIIKLSNNNVENLITNKIIVLPPGWRDYSKIDNKISIHPLTDVYSKIIEQNKTFEVSNANSSKLYRLIIKLIDLLAEQFGTKTGFIREQLASKTVNYTARSVISPNPNLEIDQIAIPFTALLQLYKPQIINSILTKHKQEFIEITKTARQEIKPAVNDITKLINKISNYPTLFPQELINFFRKVLEQDVLPDAVVVYKRDPALHKTSWLAAKPVIADQDTIQIHPLACAPLGGDFDGDSVDANITIRVKSKKTNKITYFRDLPIGLVIAIPKQFVEGSINHE